ncbi:MAG: transposase, partial [Actinobacteria bacterium]
ANYYAYGYRRMWKALRRAGEPVPRCRVQRLMRANGIVGAKRRGSHWLPSRGVALMPMIHSKEAM